MSQFNQQNASAATLPLNPVTGAPFSSNADAQSGIGVAGSPGGEDLSKSVNPKLHAMIDFERHAAFPRPYLIQRFRDYCRGKQIHTLTEDQKKVLEGLTTKTYCDNVIRRIISTIAARVRFERFDVPEPDAPSPGINKPKVKAPVSKAPSANAASAGGGATAGATGSKTKTPTPAVSDPVKRYLDRLVVLNWVKRLAGTVHYAAIRDGNHYVSLEWDNDAQRVRLTRELAWNGKCGMFISYTNSGREKYAVREWMDYVSANTIGLQGDALIPVRRRTVNFPNRIERYALLSNGWQWYALPAELRDPDKPATPDNIITEAEKPGPQPWTVNGEADGEALGIPVVHFARFDQPADGDDDDNERDEHHGVSAIAGRGVRAARRYQRLSLDALGSESNDGLSNPLGNRRGAEGSRQQPGQPQSCARHLPPCC